MTDLEFPPQHGIMNLDLAQIVPVAAALALIGANPVLVTIGILSREPSIQRLLKVIQVLRLPIALTLRGTRVVLSEAFIPIQARASGEPAVVATNGSDRIVVVDIKLLTEVVGSSINVVLDRVCAHAIWVVIAGDLHQAGSRTTSVGIAG